MKSFYNQYLRLHSAYENNNFRKYCFKSTNKFTFYFRTILPLRVRKEKNVKLVTLKTLISMIIMCVLLLCIGSGSSEDVHE